MLARKELLTLFACHAVLSNFGSCKGNVIRYSLSLNKAKADPISFPGLLSDKEGAEKSPGNEFETDLGQGPGATFIW